MSMVSDKKKGRIKEEILRVLYDKSPVAVSTCFVANEVIRDNEFVLTLLEEMEKVGFVMGLRGGCEGKNIRVRWRLSDNAFRGYQKVLDVKN